MVSMGEAIHDYIGRGWSIIPIRRGDKRPIIRWEEFRHRRPSEAEAHHWLFGYIKILRFRMSVLDDGSGLRVFKAEFFKALAHPVRIRILEILRGGERSVQELQGLLDLDQPVLPENSAFGTVLRFAD